MAVLFFESVRMLNTLSQITQGAHTGVAVLASTFSLLFRFATIAVAATTIIIH